MRGVTGKASLLFERTSKSGESILQSQSQRLQFFRFLCASGRIKLPCLCTNSFGLLSQFTKGRETTPQKPDHPQRCDSDQDGRGKGKKADRFENFVPDAIHWNAINDGNRAADSSVRFPGLKNPDALSNNKAVIATSHLNVLESRRPAG